MFTVVLLRDACALEIYFKEKSNFAYMKVSFGTMFLNKVILNMTFSILNCLDNNNQNPLFASLLLLSVVITDFSENETRRIRQS